MNDYDPPQAVDGRLHDYFDRLDQSTRSLAPTDTWARVAARLATPALRGTMPPMIDTIPAHDATPRIARPTPRPPRLVAAVAAVVLLALLSVGIFALIHRAAHPATTVPPTTICAPAQIKADLPRGADITNITMITPTEGWLVGSAGSAVLVQQRTSLLMHFIDCRWQRVANVAQLGVEINQIALGSVDDGWAAGSAYGADHTAIRVALLHYQHGRWSSAAVPAIEQQVEIVFSLQMTTADTGWMIGAKTVGNRYIFHLFHYQAGSWTEVTNTPFGASGGYRYLAVTAPDDAWLWGFQSTQASQAQSLVAHYHAGQWTTYPLPQTTSFANLSAGGPDDIWLTTLSQPGDPAAVAYHFDGAAWRVTATGLEHPAQQLIMLNAHDGWSFPMQTQPPSTHIIDAAQHLTAQGVRAVTWPFHDIEQIGRVVSAGDGGYWMTGLRSNAAVNGPSVVSVLLHFVNGAWTAYSPTP